MTKSSILIVSLFGKTENKTGVYTSAASQLAQLLINNKIPVIKTSYYQNKIFRLSDTVFSILLNYNKFQIAVVPLYGTKPSFLWQEAATRLLKYLNKKIILVVHGGSIEMRMKDNAAPFLKALQRADFVVCPSTYLLEVLRRYNIQSVLIENVLNLSKYQFIQKKNLRPHIIWMRAFEDVYNPQMAVRVAMLLKKKYSDFKMIMAGSDKGLLSTVQTMINSNGLQHNLSLPGFINLQQKLQFAAEYDIYICTNRIDNAPVSIIEFMAMGVPVVSVNSGGIPYLIEDGKNGLLVNVDDDEAMVQQIEKLLCNPELAHQIIFNALNFSLKFDEPVVLKKWETVFDQLKN